MKDLLEKLKTIQNAVTELTGFMDRKENGKFKSEKETYEFNGEGLNGLMHSDATDLELVIYSVGQILPESMVCIHDSAEWVVEIEGYKFPLSMIFILHRKLRIEENKTQSRYRNRKSSDYVPDQERAMYLLEVIKEFKYRKLKKNEKGNRKLKPRYKCIGEATEYFSNVKELLELFKKLVFRVDCKEYDEFLRNHGSRLYMNEFRSMAGRHGCIKPLELAKIKKLSKKLGAGIQIKNMGSGGIIDQLDQFLTSNKINFKLEQEAYIMHELHK